MKSLAPFLKLEAIQLLGDRRLRVLIISCCTSAAWAAWKAAENASPLGYRSAVAAFTTLLVGVATGFCLALAPDAFPKERERGTLPLLRLTPRGLRRLLAAKVLLLTAVVAAAFAATVPFAAVAALGAGGPLLRWYVLGAALSLILLFLPLLTLTLGISALCASTRAAYASTTAMLAALLLPLIVPPSVGSMAETLAAWTPFLATERMLNNLAWGAPLDPLRALPCILAGAALVGCGMARLHRSSPSKWVT